MQKLLFGKNEDKLHIWQPTVSITVIGDTEGYFVSMAHTFCEIGLKSQAL